MKGILPKILNATGFVHINVFMKHVLYIPENRKELWEQTVEQTERNKVHPIAYSDYSHQCRTLGSQEWRFYKLLIASS